MQAKTRGAKVSPTCTTSRRVTINESKASIYPSLQLTDFANNNDKDTSCLSGESTASGDSFAFQIDWSDGAFDDSFDDPYLLPMSKIRERGRQRQRNQTEGLKDRDEYHQEDYTIPMPSSNVQPLENTISSFSIHEQSYDDIAPDLIALHSSETEDTSGGGSTPSRPTSSPASSPASSIRRLPLEKELPLSFAIPAAPLDDRVDTVVETASTASQQSSQQPKPRADPKRRKAQEKRMYWIRVVASRLANYGSDNLETADAYMELGQAELQVNEYVGAKSSFQSAYCTFRRFRKYVAIAKALDCLGVANSRGGAACFDQSLELLQDAFWIRRQKLGVWHVDTVDTMNRIAMVHALAENFSEARRCYWEVFWVRKAIFGAQHPSVAVAAHGLANSFVKLGSLEDGSNFYHIAMEIFDKMGLPSENPAVSKLLRDMKQLEQVHRRAEI